MANVTSRQVLLIGVVAVILTAMVLTILYFPTSYNSSETARNNTIVTKDKTILNSSLSRIQDNDVIMKGNFSNVNQSELYLNDSNSVIVSVDILNGKDIGNMPSHNHQTVNLDIPSTQRNEIENKEASTARDKRRFKYQNIIL